MSRLQIWDTPTPPKAYDCAFFYMSDNTFWERFRRANLARTRGITFLYFSGHLYGLHVHDPTDPCALTTYQRLSNRRQKATVWIYLPVPRADSIIAFGAGKSDDGSYILACVHTQVTANPFPTLV